jgi:hypothetical protein
VGATLSPPINKLNIFNLQLKTGTAGPGGTGAQRPGDKELIKVLAGGGPNLMIKLNPFTIMNITQINLCN